MFKDRLEVQDYMHGDVLADELNLKTEYETGEKRLLGAILTRAIRDAINGGIYQSEQEMAMEWIFSDYKPRLDHFTFEEACDYLGLNSVRLRRKVFERV